jgi:excisionase family DNA binding protein
MSERLEEREFLTSAEVLRLLQIGRTKLWELVREGAFPAYRLGSGRSAPLRYRRSEVLRWIERNRIAPVPRSEPLEEVAPSRRRG